MRLVEQLGFCLAPKFIVEEKVKVRFMYREEPDTPIDSGWRFFSDEGINYLNDPKNIGLYDINVIAEIDESVIPLLHSDIGSAFARENDNDEFEPVKLNLKKGSATA